jgi:hypothetical protein
VEEFDRKRDLKELRIRLEGNIKMDLTGIGIIWTALIWLRIRTNGQRL